MKDWNNVIDILATIIRGAGIGIEMIITVKDIGEITRRMLPDTSTKDIAGEKVSWRNYLNEDTVDTTDGKKKGVRS